MHVAAHSPLSPNTRIRNTAPIRNANANAVDVGNSKHVRSIPITATTTSVPAKRGPPKILSIGNGTEMRILPTLSATAIYSNNAIKKTNSGDCK